MDNIKTYQMKDDVTKTKKMRFRSSQQLHPKAKPIIIRLNPDLYEFVLNLSYENSKSIQSLMVELLSQKRIEQTIYER